MTDLVIVLHKDDELDMLGQAKFSITGMRRLTWLDKLLFYIHSKLPVKSTDTNPSIFTIATGLYNQSCELAVYPGKKIQDIVWQHDKAKNLDYSR